MTGGKTTKNMDLGVTHKLFLQIGKLTVVFANKCKSTSLYKSKKYWTIFYFNGPILSGRADNNSGWAKEGDILQYVIACEHKI